MKKEVITKEENSSKSKRGAKKGERRGGRVKGTPNKRTQALQELIEQEYPGFNPILRLIKIALDLETPLELQVTCLKEVAKYTNAQLKAIEASFKEQNNSMFEFMEGLKKVVQ